MKRTSSEGKALDEHPTKDETNYTHTHKAKSHVSNCGERMLNIDNKKTMVHDYVILRFSIIIMLLLHIAYQTKQCTYMYMYNNIEGF